ncbi:hypothetical protein L1987_30831 [Smallanthus sonchifolius]|uniref:Uncharacterized protein n=1 Tax=Smallanthus sonchifolius TaxID=185202 RepID=A0ACB9I5C5_9ASTR|nr:hypothetical protein L1987_30831 [Smallanthus sonchifolius]
MVELHSLSSFFVPKDEREELKRLEKLVNKYESGLIQRVDWLDRLAFKSMEKKSRILKAIKNEVLIYMCLSISVVLNIELFCRPNLLIPASITSTNELVVWDLEMGKINPSEHKQIKLVRSLNRATDGAKFFTWVPSEANFFLLKTYYDIRKQCEGCMCYDFSHIENLISKKSVKDAPGVRDIDFVSCSRVVYQAMIMDWTRYLEAGIPHLLEDGINLVIRCSYKFMHYIGKVGLQCKDYGFH